MRSRLWHVGGMTAAPSSPFQRWRLRYGDEVFGPFDRAELETLLADGRLDRDSLLAEEGGGENWRRAGEIPELSDLFASTLLPAKAKPPRVRRRARQPDTTYLHVVYALYLAEFFTLLTALVGVIVAYVKRGEAAGTWQATHYDWQIRTFWWWLLFVVIGVVTQLIGVGFIILFLAGAWFLYRIAKGWLRLSQLRAIENPSDFF